MIFDKSIPKETSSCIECSQNPIIYIPYLEKHLCEDHFIKFIEERVKSEISEQIKIKKGKIAVGLSGGKDSSVLLYLLSKYFKGNDVEIAAITIDEGIAGYREKTIKSAEKLTNELGISHYIVKLSDIVGVTMDYVASTDDELKPCTYCGVWRRKALNKKAKEINAKYLAIGTNLDDYSQTILMNIMQGDINKLIKLAPHSENIVKGLVPRVVPLRTIPEKEILIYAMLKEIPYSSVECPYATYALRNEFRNSLSKLERDIPGTRDRIVKFYLQLKRVLKELEQNKEIEKCRICGDPTDGNICKSCMLIKRVKELSARYHRN